MKSIKNILLLFAVGLLAVSCDKAAELEKAKAEEAAAAAKAEVEAHKQKSGSSPGPTLKPPANTEPKTETEAAPPATEEPVPPAEVEVEPPKPAETATEASKPAEKETAPPAEAEASKPAETPKPKPAEGEKTPAADAGEAPVEASAVAAEAGDIGSGGGDWHQWGRDGSNNMMSPSKEISVDITSGEIGDDGNVTGAKGTKWVVKLGSQAYGTPTIHQGRVFVGTNNEEPRLESVIGDRGIVMALDEQTGDLQWQFSIPKLGAGKVSDWEFLGICSSILLDGKHGYVVSNRGEIICLDLYGLSDGNDGPFEDEGKYMVGGLEKLNESEPVELGEQDADIVWGYDMRSELGVFPHNITSSSVVLAGDKVFASTSNGVDWSHINIPAPVSPCLIALDKETGELVGEEASGIGERIMHCNWSSPGYAEDLNGKATVIFGAGDGWTYGFDATDFDVEEDGGEKYYLMKELWKVDCCPKEYRIDEDGEPIKYATYPGPSEIISSPVVYNNKVYACIGQDPEHGEGLGAVTCIDPSKGTGEDAIVWQFKEIGRTISTPSIVDGLVYISDYSGRLFCLDAETGESYWEYDTLSHIWGSTLVVDGKVFLGNEDGELIVIKAGKDADSDGNGEITRLKKDSKTGEIIKPEETLAVIEYPAPIYSTCVVANGVLYVMTQTHLYAYGK